MGVGAGENWPLLLLLLLSLKLPSQIASKQK